MGKEKALTTAKKQKIKKVTEQGNVNFGDIKGTLKRTSNNKGSS